MNKRIKKKVNRKADSAMRCIFLSWSDASCNFDEISKLKTRVHGIGDRAFNRVVRWNAKVYYSYTCKHGLRDTDVFNKLDWFYQCVPTICIADSRKQDAQFKRLLRLKNKQAHKITADMLRDMFAGVDVYDDDKYTVDWEATIK